MSAFAPAASSAARRRKPQVFIILGRCPKPRRFGLAILRIRPHALRYRLLAIIII